MMTKRMPKHVVILCHPDPASFNAAVAERYCDTVRAMGHEAELRDLYRIGFDPVLKGEERPCDKFTPADDVAAELDLLADVDVLVLVYPIWFGMPPAMLKGYVDRVLGSGFTFSAVRQQVHHPLLTGKRLLSFTSSGNTRQWLEERGAWLSLRHLFDDYLKHAFSMESAEHIHFPAIVEGLSKRFVDEHLHQVEEAARHCCSCIAT